MSKTNEPINDEQSIMSTSSRGLAIQRSSRELQRVSVENVVYDVTIPDPDGGKAICSRTLLKDIDFTIPPKSLIAIMGATGAGKTTMLNVLANRITPSEGMVKVNGKDYRTIPMQRRLGYVMQEDRLMNTQTVRETFTFAADLQLPESTTVEERAQRVNDVIKELGLVGVADSMIGSDAVGGRGISGGERKRVAIGLVLIPDPDILLLDEPTTGLDSFTAESVIDTLGELAEAGRTVICTIHQPSSHIFNRFTQLLLLAMGRVVYCGAADKSMEYFTQIGFPCPEYSNPPDFYMKLLRTGAGYEAASLRENLTAGQAFSEMAAGQWEKQDSTPYLAVDNSPPDTPTVQGSTEEQQRIAHDMEEYSGYAVGFKRQFATLAKRNMTNMLRSPTSGTGRLAQTIVQGLLLGAVFWDLDDEEQGVFSKQAALLFLSMTQAMLPMMGVLHTMPVELDLVLRESQASLYSITAQFLAKTATEIPFLLFFPTLFLSISYWMVGFNDTADAFWTQAGYLICTAILAQSFGTLISAASPSVDVAMLLGPLIFLPMMLVAGFFNPDMASWLEWFQDISFVKWSYEASLLVEFEDRVLDVNASDPNVTYVNGNDVLEELSVDSTLPQVLFVELGYIVGLRFLTWLVLLKRSKNKIQQ